MSRELNTRSGMLWEVERILKECNELNQLPQILIMENVPQVHGKKNKQDFEDWCKFLESLGYTNNWKDLNAKNFGIPQNRNRCFMVSILNGEKFEFPCEQELKLKLKDLLETDVDEKYFLSDKMRSFISTEDERHQGSLQPALINKSISNTITTREGCTRSQESNYICNELPENYDLKQLKQVGQIYPNSGNPQAGRIYDADGISPCLDTMQGGNREPKIVVKDKLDNEFIIKDTKQLKETIEQNELADGKSLDLYNRQVHDNISQTLDTGYHNSQRVCVYSETEKQLFTEDGNIRRYIDSDIIDEFKEGQMATTSYPNGYGHGPRTHDESITLNTLDRSSVKQNLRIRKLTAKECFRLMGVKDSDFENIAKNQSNSSLYHLAGDSIVVNVLMAIFKQLI